MDRSFSVLFKERMDSRDQRPLTFGGKWVQAAHVQEQKSFWKSSALVTEGRTEPAVQVASKDMQVIEDLLPGALPASVDTDAATVQGAAKYEQLGSDAWGKLLGAAFNGVELASKNVVVIVDLSPSVGNLTEARPCAHVDH